MQVLRTTTATPVVEPNYGVTRTSAGSAAAVPPPAVTSEVRQQTTAAHEDTSIEVAKQRRSAQPAELPNLSGSDRAAIASATGFYISPTGEVTPDGMPPWSFIMQYLQRRHAPTPTEAPTQPTPTAAASTSAAEEGPRFDLQV
jgi:hypothetical protein